MTHPLTARDLLELRMVGQATVSPDGTRAAFVEAFYDLDADDTKWSIHTMPTDGSAPSRRLTDGARDSLPRFSPDAAMLAFLAATEQPWRNDLHIVDAASGAPRTTIILPRGIDAFWWSPESDGFALVGGPEYPDDPYRRAASDAEQRRARYQQRVIRVERFDYRVSGTWLDDEPPQLWWAPLAGAPRMVTDGAYSVSTPRFTPDGRLAFASSREPGSDREPFARVWAVTKDGGEPEPLTDQVSQLRGFDFGPDGSVRYVGLPVKTWSFGSHNPRLFVDGKDLTGDLDRPVSRMSEVQSMTLDYLTATDSPVLDPSGATYFHVVDAGSAHVYRLVDLVPEPVITGRRIIGDFAIGANTLVFTASSGDRAIGLFACDADGSNERLLYDPNPWLAEREVGEIRPFRVALDDGSTMDAWATLPAGYEEGTGALPAILDIHPGPHSSFPWDYRINHRVLANAGYVVLSCNQPGSQGYGEAYSMILDGRWGEADLPAYLACCDEGERLGFLDRHRIGVTGATYGGHAALWAIAHTDRFKAAVVNRPITQLDAMYGDADVGWSFLPGTLGAEPWEDPELYRRLSPTTYVEQMDAPVRFLTFAGNGRTTVAAAESLYLRLRKLGKTADLLVFPPGSATVLMPNRPWSMLKLLDAEQEWFDRWVKPTT